MGINDRKFENQPTQLAGSVLKESPYMAPACILAPGVQPVHSYYF
jgi:hypothetical protein